MITCEGRDLHLPHPSDSPHLVADRLSPYSTLMTSKLKLHHLNWSAFHLRLLSIRGSKTPKDKVTQPSLPVNISRDEDSLSQTQPQPGHFYYVCLIFCVCFSCTVSLIKTIINYCYWQVWLGVVSFKKYRYFKFWLRLNQRIPEMSGSASAKAIYVYISWMKQYPAKLPVTIVNYGLY